jgi:amino acid transporter
LGLFAFIAMFAVANSALINMLMASRLLYGMSRERVLPGQLGMVHPTRRTPYIAILFTTALAFGLIAFVGGYLLSAGRPRFSCCVYSPLSTYGCWFFAAILLTTSTSSRRRRCQ